MKVEQVGVATPIRIEDIAIPNIPPLVRIEIPWQNAGLPHGDYYIYCTLDPNNAVPEVDEGNNEGNFNMLIW
jgi:hypothetical protein